MTNIIIIANINLERRKAEKASKASNDDKSTFILVINCCVNSFGEIHKNAISHRMVEQ